MFDNAYELGSLSHVTPVGTAPKAVFRSTRNFFALFLTTPVEPDRTTAPIRYNRLPCHANRKSPGGIIDVSLLRPTRNRRHHFLSSRFPPSI
jgi:hypothetical protein